MNTAAFERADVERFRAVVEQRLGLHFDDGKLDHLADILRERMKLSGHGRCDAYLGMLSAGGPDEARALAAVLTVGETYFFRYTDHFRAFVETVLPQRTAVQAKGAPLRILSAGCASGEEAYSLAISVREHLPGFEPSSVEIQGIDLNPQMLEKAVAGRYTSWSLRETSPVMKERYFRTDGRELVLDEGVRAMVTFAESNLVADDPRYWPTQRYDVVFCRNVTMYFSRATMARVVARIHRSLAPGGFLFLGHAETLRGVSQDFHLRHTHDTFYYQRRDSNEGRGRQVFGLYDGAEPASRAEPISTERDPADGSWVEAIQRATDRIATLARMPSSLPGDPAGASPLPWDLVAIKDLLRQERFADATSLLEGLPEASQVDPDTQLLRAVLLTNTGRLVAAELVCEQILARDELNAEAHYLQALCRDHVGDRRGALMHDRAATYLDPAFVMPRIHLGLLARRSGDLAQAQSELGHALTLLVRDDAARIALLGGGCTREALAELCRSELRICGAAP